MRLREQVVYKMTEKFDRNDGVPAERDVAKRTYYLAEGRIHTLFHYPDGDVTRASKVARKTHTDAVVMGNAALCAVLGFLWAS